MDMATITAAYNGLKIVKDIFNEFAELKTETASQEKLMRLLKKSEKLKMPFFS